MGRAGATIAGLRGCSGRPLPRGFVPTHAPIPHIWSGVEDVNGDLDTKFKFRVSDLGFRSGDDFLVLGGESSTSDCTYYGIDSVRAAGGNSGGAGDPENAGKGGPQNEGKGNGT